MHPMTQNPQKNNDVFQKIRLHFSKVFMQQLSANCDIEVILQAAIASVCKFIRLSNIIQMNTIPQI